MLDCEILASTCPFFSGCLQSVHRLLGSNVSSISSVVRKGATGKVDKHTFSVWACSASSLMLPRFSFLLFSGWYFRSCSCVALLWIVWSVGVCAVEGGVRGGVVNVVACDLS